MSENTITVDDIVEAHNKTSTGFNDLVRWHTSIVIGAMAMIISSVLNQAMRECEAWLFMTSIILLSLSVVLLAVFLYRKTLLGYEKARVLASKINEAKQPIKVSVPKYAIWSLWFGYGAMLLGFVSLALFVGVRVCNCKANEYKDIHLSAQIESVGAAAERTTKAVNDLGNAVRNLSNSL